MRLSQPQQIMANDRKILTEAYAGDIIGVFDPGVFSIGDTLCMPKEQFTYEGIPTFAPEHFARVRQVDTMKRKQFIKGINQIAQEGAIQIFQEFNTGMEEIIVGVVGVLQFDVLKFRLESEYGVEIRMDQLPYEYIRWIENKDIDVSSLSVTSDTKKIKDLKDINFEQVDFLQKADNVYRTSDYIVKQKICTTLDEDTLITHLISDDTYYARTQKRDAEYNVIFRERGKEIDGKRIKSSMFTRKYID